MPTKATGKELKGHPERVQLNYTAPAPPSQEKMDFVNTESKREKLKQIVLSADEQELDRYCQGLCAKMFADPG